MAADTFAIAADDDLEDDAAVEAALERRGAILEAVRLAAESFLDPATNWTEHVPGVLATLAQATGTSRVYLFENYRWDDDGEVWATQTFEWSAPGIRSIADAPELAALPFRATGFGRWVEFLKRGEPVVGLRRDMLPEEQVQMTADETLSIAVVPITVEDAWWGLLGFDECAFERIWTAGEVDGLRAAASTIGAAILADRAEEDLRAREREYRAVFEATGDGLVVTDRTGRLVAANPAFCAMHGATLDELLGRDFTTWVHPDWHDMRAGYADVVREGGVFTTIARDVRMDGTSFPVEVRGSPITFDGEDHVLGVVRDITERAQARALLERRVQALSAVAASLTIDQPLQDTLEGVARAVVEGSEALACSVQLPDPRGGLRLLAADGLPDGYLDGLEASWAAGVRSPTSDALREQQVRWVVDAPRVGLGIAAYGPLHPSLREANWDSILVLPMNTVGDSGGALNVYYAGERRPSEDEEAFLRALTDQAAVAVENDRLLRTAQGAAALEERQRLARELHDSVSQALYGIALGARTARRVAEHDRAALVSALDYVLDLAEAALAEMRALIFELRPEALASEGIVAALDRQLRALHARHGIDVRAELGDEPDATLPVKEALYRIGQESLHNVVKHADATSVAVHLRSVPGGLELAIEDDGRGFDPDGSFPGHLGLQSMRERAEALGGTFRLASDPGRGSRIVVTLPTEVDSRAN